MTTLDAAQREFVTAAGYPAEGWRELPADASPRRYHRLADSAQGPCLLMVTAPDAPDTIAYLAIARHLAGIGLSSPRILLERADLGLVLIEDFGDATYTNLLAQGADETALYELAIDALVALHEHPDSTAIDLPPYGMDALMKEALLFSDWFAPAFRPGADLGAFRAGFETFWRDALSDVATRRETLVLRDYHVDNLLLLNNRHGPARCGLLDFQDGLIGAAAYDLASLTQDARRDVDPALEAALLDRYLSRRPGIDRARFMADFHLLAAQRHTKVAGIFVRLCRRDGKDRYLAHMPRVLRLMSAAMDRAGLTDLRALLDTHLPGWQQGGAAILPERHGT